MPHFFGKQIEELGAKTARVAKSRFHKTAIEYFIMVSVCYITRYSIDEVKEKLVIS